MTQQLSCINLRIERWRSFLLGLLAFFVVVINSSACTPNANTQTDRANSDAECHIIQHSKGETCVPNDPQRVVMLGGLDNALSLGVRPVGSDGLGIEEIHLRDKLEGIEDVGGNNAPSIEKILALKPDLILAEDYVAVDYDILSSIAPTVLIPFEHSGQWKEVFMRHAAALGKTAEAEQVMDNYYARLEEFQKRMGNRAAETEVSIVRVYPTHVNLYLKDSFCGTVVADAGLSRPPAQDLSASEAETLFGNSIQYTISREKIQDADGDVIFLWAYDSQDETAQQTQAEKAKLKADPLWSTLTAVQQDRVYEVPGYWIGNGPIAANAVIDDLFKYLIESPQS
jgi:iron complex transport system substrate-binding protein